MNQLTEVIRFMTIGWLVMLAVQLLRARFSPSRLVPAVAFTLCVMGYLLVDWEPLHNTWMFYLFLIPAFVLPYAFWVFSCSIFEDGFRLRPWLGLLLLGYLLVHIVTYVIVTGEYLAISPAVITTISLTQRILALFFVILGIIAAVRHRDADLITARLQFRYLFIFLSAVIIIVTLLSEIAFAQDSPPIWLELLQKTVIAILTLYFTITRLELKPGFFLDKTGDTEKEVRVSVVDTTLLTNLRELMEGQKYYRTEGLTIRQLAERLEVKEYKLRQTINQHLDFRNFNDFLNSHRITEACKILQDPEKKELTILAIAYDLGYNSLAPFNRAFKDITGTTPSDWRRSEKS